MAQNYFSIVTNKGRNKLALSAAGGAAVIITHFAIGDGNGAEVNPTAASTALVREVWRTPVESVVIDPLNPSAVLVTSIIPTAAGGWWMREFGIFDVDGDMIAVAKPVSQYKPTALEGQLEDIRYEFQIIIGETANVTMLVDPSVLLASRAWVESRKVPVAQLSLTSWVPVKSMTVTAPPANPTSWDTYVIPTGATGAWAGHAQKLAEWTGQSWNFVTAPAGHGISLPDGRIFEKIDGVYIEKPALDAQTGKWTYGTAAGAANSINAALAPVPSSLVAGITVRLKMISTNAGPSTLNLNGLGVKNIVYDETGGDLNGADWIAGSIVTLIYDGNVWRLRASVGLFDNRYSKLTVPPSTTFYVIGPTGSDSNSGVEATPDKGFATIQGAINAITSRFIVPGTVTLRVSNGTYAGFNVPPSFISAWDIIGNVANPAQVKISSPTANVNNGRGVRNGGATVILSGIEITSYYENVSNVGGMITIKDLNVNMPITTDRFAVASYSGRMNVYGNIKISGSGLGFLDASQGSTIQIGYSDAAVSNPTNLNYNSPSFSAANVSASGSGNMVTAPGVLNITGSATGKRYTVYANGTIGTSGSGANYFPGSVAGTVASGGQYL